MTHSPNETARVRSLRKELIKIGDQINTRLDEDYLRRRPDLAALCTEIDALCKRLKTPLPPLHEREQ
jgi:hypothetical protein